MLTWYSFPLLSPTFDCKAQLTKFKASDQRVKSLTRFFKSFTWRRLYDTETHQTVKFGRLMGNVEGSRILLFRLQEEQIVLRKTVSTCVFNTIVVITAISTINNRNAEIDDKQTEKNLLFQECSRLVALHVTQYQWSSSQVHNGWWPLP